MKAAVTRNTAMKRLTMDVIWTLLTAAVISRRP